MGTYILGGLVLRDFALALFVGLTVGAYSSIFVATPVLAWLKEREPRYRALRARAEADLATSHASPPVARPERPAVFLAVDGLNDVEQTSDELPEGVTESEEVSEMEAASAPTAPRPSTTSPSSAPTTIRGSANPRPRQQRRRKRR